MTIPLSAVEVLNREFLETRSKVLEVAAALDRMQRASGDVQSDPRMQQLRAAMNLLLEHRVDRAEQVQLVFSRAYDEKWQSGLKTTSR